MSTPVVGIVGGGQLARMTQQAAIALGVRLRVLDPDPAAPAVLAGAEHVPGEADDADALRRLAEGCDVVTFDHEGVPPELLATLTEEGMPLAPPAAAKLLAQDKLVARARLAELGLPVPPYAAARTREEVAAFGAEHGWPIVAKAPRGGYDGRGVWTLAAAEEAVPLLAELPAGLLLEPRLRIERELAVLVARAAAGERAVYPVVETVQQDAMCREILAPAEITPALEEEARALALDLVERIEAVGIVAVELFLTADGLLVNELALRPHNSGHYTIEGCVTSQFEQHLRAILGWPLGAADLVTPSVTCVNVVGAESGDPRERLPSALAVPGAHVHLYGKASRPGRKLGHVTVVGEQPQDTQVRARRAAALLEGSAS